MRTVVLALLVWLAGNALALKPRWVGNTPKELNHTYRFVEKVSYGSSIEAARLEGLKVLAQDQQLRNAVIMNIKTGNLSDINQTFRNGELSEVIQNKVTIDMEVAGEQFRLQGTVVDEYVAGRERGLYKLHTLYMVAVTNSPVFDRTHLTTSYGVAPVAMSVIPGMGQIYKGSMAKGLCMLGGEAVAAIGIILCENQRADYKAKMHEQPRFAKSYNTKANNWETGRNICIGAAAALWIYNIIDAAVAKGARRVKVSPANGNGFALTPLITTEGGGLSFAYTF